MGSQLLATATRYGSTKELRFKLALRTVDECKAAGHPILIVDGSPIPDIAVMLRERGAIVYRQQTKGMGPGRRETIFYAVEHCKSTGIKAINFTEPEKWLYPRFAAAVVGPILDGTADIVMSRKTEAARLSYPKYQQEVELVMLAAYAAALKNQGINSYLGPIAFSVPAAIKYILLPNPKDYGVEDTYVQMWAPLLALKDGGRVTLSPEFDVLYPPEQLAEEEGPLDDAMREKRNWQTRTLIEAFKKLAAV